jgi:hypothetical protein
MDPHQVRSQPLSRKPNSRIEAGVDRHVRRSAIVGLDQRI